MKKCRRTAFLLMLVPILFGACFNLKQPRNTIEYYTLEYGPPPIGDLKSLPYVIKVDRFSAAPLYKTNRIIYQDRRFKSNAYEYHRWGVTPKDIVTFLLTRDIRFSGLFQAVLPYDSRFESSYRLEGNVDDFFQIDTRTAWEAVLSVSITLMKEDDLGNPNEILFQKTYRYQTPCERKHPRALAKAMSQSMPKVSKEIIKDIYDYLKDHESRNKH